MQGPFLLDSTTVVLYYAHMVKDSKTNHPNKGAGTMNENVKKMKSELEQVAWLAKVATEKVTPFTEANLDLLFKTLWNALEAVKNCQGD